MKLNIDLTGENGYDDEAYAEGDYLAPKAKVRLPDHVTKLRKRTRRHDEEAVSHEREV